MRRDRSLPTSTGKTRNAVLDRRTYKYVTDGRFYVIQRGEVRQSNGQLCLSAGGRPRLAWAGSVVFSSREEAERIARRMAAEDPLCPYIVMEAYVAFGTHLELGAYQPLSHVVRRNLRSLK
jgi:hypothetical protein